MHRFIVNKLKDNYFILFKDDIIQIKYVLRLINKTKIICIYNEEHYLTMLEIKSSQNYLFKLIKKLNQNNESIINIRLIIGLIRNTKWNYLLQKATELGVNEIIPFQFNRCIVKLKYEDNFKKKERWTKICKEAAEQSYRNKIPLIYNIENNLKVFKKYKNDINIVCYEKISQKLSIKKILQQNFKKITIVIGPEGGFTKSEIMCLSLYNYYLISLGKRILRSETAVIAFLSMIMYEKEL